MEAEPLWGFASIWFHEQEGSMDIRIAGTANDSIVDGPGIRFTIFVQGCTRHCHGCQNPQTWDPEGGELTTTEALEEIIAANRLLKGVTFSGGEPFQQPAPLIEIADWCHERGLDVWSYSGYLYEELLEGKAGEDALELLKKSDVVVDGPFVEAEKSYAAKWRGSTNQRVIDVQKSLETGEVVSFI